MLIVFSLFLSLVSDAQSATIMPPSPLHPSLSKATLLEIAAFFYRRIKIAKPKKRKAAAKEAI
jgi:hypothetical protein